MRIYQHDLRIAASSIEEKEARVVKALIEAHKVSEAIYTTMKVRCMVEIDSGSRRVTANLKLKPDKKYIFDSSIEEDYLSVTGEDGVIELYVHWSNLLSVSITTAR